jgi:hypothetical protein
VGVGVGEWESGSVGVWESGSGEWRSGRVGSGRVGVGVWDFILGDFSRFHFSHSHIVQTCQFTNHETDF